MRFKCVRLIYFTLQYGVKVTNDSFFPSLKQSSMPFCLLHPLNHLSYKHIGCFQDLAIMNCAVINMDMHVLL